MDVSSYTAFHLRLQWLEAILNNPESTVGQSVLGTRDLSDPPLKKEDDGTGEDADEPFAKDITQRTGELAQQLRNAVLDSGHDSLRRLVDEYDSVAGVLFPYDLSPVTTASIQPSTTASKGQSKDDAEVRIVKASDLIPSDTKIELVLGASEDMKDAERMLREIQVLVERGADGSGDLATYEPLLARLQALQATHSARVASQRKLQERVIDTLGRYDDYVTSMSRVFVDIHTQVTEMEEHATRLERRKKEREAMTY